MKIIMVLMMIFMIVICKRNKHDKSSPAILFFVMWAIIICGLSIGKIYEIENVSLSTLFIVFTGTFFFFCGCNVKKKFVILGHAKKDSSGNINTKLLICFIILSMPFYISILIKALKLIQGGTSMLYIRSLYYGIDGHSPYWATSNIMVLVKKFVLGPLQIAIIPLTIALTIKRKRNLTIIFSCIAIIVINIITSGGRYILLYVIAQIFYVLLLCNKKMYISKKNKRYLTIGVIVAVILIYMITINRNIAGGLMKKIYEYFFCCIPLLDHYQPMINEFTFGTASFNGIINPILFFINQFTHIVTPYEKTLTGFLNPQAAVNLSPSITTNAFVTCFYYPYLDFGILGIIFIMFFYGKWVTKCYRNVKRTMSERDIAIYLLVIQSIVKSIQLFPFSNTDYVLGFIYILLFTAKKVKNKEENECLQ